MCFRFLKTFYPLVVGSLWPGNLAAIGLVAPCFGLAGALGPAVYLVSMAVNGGEAVIGILALANLLASWMVLCAMVCFHPRLEKEANTPRHLSVYSKIETRARMAGRESLRMPTSRTRGTLLPSGAVVACGDFGKGSRGMLPPTETPPLPRSYTRRSPSRASVSVGRQYVHTKGGSPDATRACPCGLIFGFLHTFLNNLRTKS
jgi:hypothetical protein